MSVPGAVLTSPFSQEVAALIVNFMPYVQACYSFAFLRPQSHHIRHEQSGQEVGAAIADILVGVADIVEVWGYVRVLYND